MLQPSKSSSSWTSKQFSQPVALVLEADPTPAHVPSEDARQQVLHANQSSHHVSPNSLDSAWHLLNQ